MRAVGAVRAPVLPTAPAHKLSDDAPQHGPSPRQVAEHAVAVKLTGGCCLPAVPRCSRHSGAQPLLHLPAHSRRSNRVPLPAQKLFLDRHTAPHLDPRSRHLPHRDKCVDLLFFDVSGHGTLIDFSLLCKSEHVLQLAVATGQHSRSAVDAAEPLSGQRDRGLARSCTLGHWTRGPSDWSTSSSSSPDDAGSSSVSRAPRAAATSWATRAMRRGNCVV